MDMVCRKAADAVNDAVDRLEPARITIATGQAEGKIAYKYYAPDLYDRRMSVIRATSPEGKTIATLVNYAVHPEVLGNEVGICSPDLVGPLCDKLEADAGGLALFMNGAQGGMITADNRDLQRVRDPLRGYWEDTRSWEECERIGRLMAGEASRILKDAPAEEDPQLRRDAMEVNFPVESPAMWGRHHGLPARVSPRRGPFDRRADRPRQPRRRPDPDDPGRGVAQYRLLPQAEDAREAQPVARAHQRGVRLHPDQG
jgi:hypothetical protein